MTVMTHVKALQAGHSSQGTSEPITPGLDANCILYAPQNARAIFVRSYDENNHIVDRMFSLQVAKSVKTLHKVCGG